jgi:cholesterol transport system auxiliary component
MIRLACVLPVLVLLGGCVSFGPKPAKVLMTMSTTAGPAAGATRTASDANTILVLNPTATAAIQTTRVPVYDGTALAYVKDIAWNEPPNRAMQRMLSETISARAGRVVLDPRQFSASPALRLSGQLQRFGVDPFAMQVVAILDAQLSRGGTVEVRRFEARAPLTAIEGAAVGTALNRAANDLAGQVADWVG